MGIDNPDMGNEFYGKVMAQGLGELPEPDKDGEGITVPSTPEQNLGFLPPEKANAQSVEQVINASREKRGLPPVDINELVTTEAVDVEEIRETVQRDPSLQTELGESLMKSFFRNAGDERSQDRILYIIAALGIGLMGVNAVKYIEQGYKESHPGETLTGAAVNAAGRFVTEVGQGNEQKKIESMISESDIVTTKILSLGLDPVIKDTGWTGEYNNDQIKAAIMSLDENKDVDFSNLQPNQEIHILVKRPE